MREQLSKWIEAHDWQMWFTGTFKPRQCMRDTIKTKRAFKDFLDELGTQHNLQSIQYFMAVERFKSGFDTHIHALLNGIGDIRFREFGEAWRKLHGRETIEGYQKDKGADYYLTKYVTKELCDWDFKLIKK